MREKTIDEMSNEEIVIYLMKSFQTTQYNEDAKHHFNKMLLRLVN